MLLYVWETAVFVSGSSHIDDQNKKQQVLSIFMQLIMDNGERGLLLSIIQDSNDSNHLT